MHRATVILALVCALVSACSRTGASSSATTNGASAPAGSPSTGAQPTAESRSAAAPATPELPATLTDINLAAADMGGAIEQLSANYDPDHPDYGPGLLGRRLIDGRPGPTWFTPSDWNQNRVYNPDSGWAKFPVDVVLSFYERQPALVGAVTIVVPQTPVFPLTGEPTAAPKDVEIWTSMDLAPERFVKAIAATVETSPGEHTVQFPARQARFLRLRVLSGESPRMVEIAELRVFEAARPDYVALFARAPDVQRWKGSPRQAAQRGLDWLQQSAADWSVGPQACFGCHVQSQAIMGQAVALANNYRVSMPAMGAFTGLIRARQAPDGSILVRSDLSSTVFGVMGLAHADEATGSTNDPVLLKAVDFVIKQQKDDGVIPEDFVEPPVVQGEFMMTANALAGMKWAAAHSKDARYGQAADRALNWIASHDPDTTQDEIFKILALVRYGTPDQKRLAWSVVERLSSEQLADGGWKETQKTDGSNAFATGQVLYALKQAGISVGTPVFKRGVDYLLRTQIGDSTTGDGSWKAIHTQSQRKSDFAPTMWAVIGLAGAYGTEPVGAVQVSKQQGGNPSARNLEIVLDVSGSMKTTLGNGTRWTTALDTLKSVLDKLPADMNVGLRAYGHRYPANSAQTCSDTELLVPVGKLDRDRLFAAASALSPRGETPLIRSSLETLKDLKAAGGGTVILITDGEESCQGNAKDAAAKLKASGLDLRLNIVGFTLTGQTVQAQLKDLAGSTGGHFYAAQDGTQLSAVVQFAALQRPVYDVVDAQNRVVFSGQTSDMSRELPAGNYRLRMTVLGQALEEPLTIAPNQTVALSLDLDGGRVVLRRK